MPNRCQVGSKPRELEFVLPAVEALSQGPTCFVTEDMAKSDTVSVRVGVG